MAWRSCLPGNRYLIRQGVFIMTMMTAPGPLGLLGGILAGGGEATRHVVIIIPGSGPTDCDGNNPLGVNSNTYKLLAEGLSSTDIAVIRIDKRGMFTSAGAVKNANHVVMDDYVQDMQQWVATARQRYPVAKVWLLGHSEGGLVALCTAIKSPEAIAGIILASTPGRPLGEILCTQLAMAGYSQALRQTAQAIIDGLSAGESVAASAIPEPLLPLFYPEVQGFLRSLLALDPVALIRQLALPILILQGSRDLQVGVEDAQRLHRAYPSSRLCMLASANHVLKFVASDDRQENIAAYRSPDLPLVPGVVTAIRTFILGVSDSPSNLSALR